MSRSWKTRLIDERMDDEVARCAGHVLTGRMVDIGCGTKPFRELLAPHVAEHVGLDRDDPFNPDARPELVGAADAIPAPDASFDSALCTAALEHLPEPEAAVRECFRVLKPGGQALFLVPLIWHLHAEPWDYWRFTKYGLEHLFRKAGFEIVESRALSGYWVTSATLFCYYVDRLRWMRRRPFKWIKLRKLLGRGAQFVARRFERLDPAQEWTWMYSLVARKPGAK